MSGVEPTEAWEFAAREFRAIGNGGRLPVMLGSGPERRERLFGKTVEAGRNTYPDDVPWH